MVLFSTTAQGQNQCLEASKLPEDCGRHRNLNGLFRHLHQTICCLGIWRAKGSKKKCYVCVVWELEIVCLWFEENVLRLAQGGAVVLRCLLIFCFPCVFSGCVSTSARWSTPTSVMVLPSPPLPSPSHSKHLEGCTQTLSPGRLLRHWPLSRRPRSAAIPSFSQFLSRISSRTAVRAELLTSVEAVCCVGPVLPRLFSRSPHRLTGKSTAVRNQNPCSQNSTKMALFVLQWV